MHWIWTTDGPGPGIRKFVERAGLEREWYRAPWSPIFWLLWPKLPCCVGVIEERQRLLCSQDVCHMEGFDVPSVDFWSVN